MLPAQILQKLLEEKWGLGAEDKDMIAMQHQFEYVLDGKNKRITSSLVVKGKDQVHTAMSITVGIPFAINLSTFKFKVCILNILVLLSSLI